MPSVTNCNVMRLGWSIHSPKLFKLFFSNWSHFFLKVAAAAAALRWLIVTDPLVCTLAGSPTSRRARRRARRWTRRWSRCWTWWWRGWSSAWTSLPPSRPMATELPSCPRARPLRGSVHAREVGGAAPLVHHSRSFPALLAVSRCMSVHPLTSALSVFCTLSFFSPPGFQLSFLPPSTPALTGQGNESVSL